ncbi:MAG: PRC-barrel domain-containing protein [Gammaproteobacteria bacterium]
MKQLKSTTACIITLGMLAGAPVLQAADQSTDRNMGRQSTGTDMERGNFESGAKRQSTTGGALDLTTSYRSEKIIGLEVKNSSGEDLGSISQIILSDTGQATHVVLSTGGVLGMATKDYIVPWSKVQLRRVGDHALIDVPKDNLSSEFSAFEVENESYRKDTDADR